MLAVLGKRLGRFGLTLHPSKTLYVDFRFKRPKGRHPATQVTSCLFGVHPCVGNVAQR